VRFSKRLVDLVDLGGKQNLCVISARPGNGALGAAAGQVALKCSFRMQTGETASPSADPVWDPIRDDPGFQKLLSEPEPETVYK